MYQNSLIGFSQLSKNLHFGKYVDTFFFFVVT